MDDLKLSDWVGNPSFIGKTGKGFFVSGWFALAFDITRGQFYLKSSNDGISDINQTMILDSQLILEFM